ncbi:hypothetical protein EZS27_024168 [termite gut metagenome]|jgi:hypothetical protein|uniref:Uncharacterized protein n=1 Tax=termite gut metagenome TaxID=433724 RepID=A0A5J4QXV6_9ZZZZ
MNKGRKVWHAFFFIVMIGAAAAVVMLLWNALIPSIIGWSAITYWQAVGILALTRILFGGIGHLHHGVPFHHLPHRHAHLREDLRGMPFNERREYIRKHIHEFYHCGAEGKPSDSEEKKDDK